MAESSREVGLRKAPLMSYLLRQCTFQDSREKAIARLAKKDLRQAAELMG